MFKAQVTNKVTDRLGELVLESVPEASTGSTFNQMQGVQRDMVATEPEIVGMDMFHKTKLSKTRSVEPGATNVSMFTQVQGDMVMTTEPEMAVLDMFHKNKFSNARSVEPGTTTTPMSVSMFSHIQGDMFNRVQGPQSLSLTGRRGLQSSCLLL